MVPGGEIVEFSTAIQIQVASATGSGAIAPADWNIDVSKPVPHLLVYEVKGSNSIRIWDI